MKSEQLRDMPYNCRLTIQPGDIVFAVDRKGRFVFWSDEARAVTGRNAEEILGTLLDSVFSEEAGTDQARLDIRSVMTGQDFSGVLRLKGGAQVTLHVFATRGMKNNQSGSARAAGVVFIGRKVTAQAESEQAVSVNQGLNRSLMRLTRDAVLLLDSDGRLVEANETFASLAGVSGKELVGRLLAELAIPESGPVIESAVNRLWKQGRAEFEFELAVRNGANSRVELKATLLEGNGQRLALAVGWGVSERVRRLKQTEASELKYQQVFAAVKDAVLLHSVAGDIIDANEGAGRLFGYNRSSLLRRRLDKLVPKHSRPWLQRLREALLRKGEFYGEGSALRGDGSELPIELASSRFLLDGEVYAITLVRDITRRKLIEQTIRESEELHRMTLNAMSDPAHVIDRDYNILLANDALLNLVRILGVNKDPTGQNLFALFPFLEKQVRPATEQVFETSRPVRLEEAFTIGGQLRKAEVDELPIIEDGKVNRVLTVIHDITERKRQADILKRLAETAMDFVELPSDTDILLHCGEQLAELLPGTVIAVNEYDEAKALLRVRCVHNLSAEASDALTGLLGARPEALVFEILKPASPVTLVSGKASEIPGGLFGAFMGRVPEEACRELAGRLGVEKVIGIGLFRNNHIYGSIVCLLGPGQVLDHGLLEAFAAQASTALGRREAEKARRQSEEMLCAVLETSPEGIAVHQDGQVVMMNPAGARMLGYDDPAEVTGMKVGDFIHPDEQAQAVERITRVLQSGPVKPVSEFRMRCRDGSYLPLEITHAVFEWQGRPAVQVAFRDISERLKAQQNLKESEERYRVLAEAAPDCVYVINPEGRLEYINSRGAIVFGCDVDKLIGRPVAELFPSEIAEEQGRNIRRVLETGQEFRVERPSVLAGRDVWLDTVLLPLCDEAGRVKSVLGVSRDLTERHEMELDLKESEERYRNVVEGGMDGIGILRNGKVAYANAQLAGLGGWTVEEVIGREFLDFVHPSQREVLADRYQRRMRGEEVPETYETVLRHRDGRQIDVEIRAGVITMGDEPANLVFVRDISETKRQVRALEQLADTAAGFIELPSEEDVLLYGAGRLAELLPGVILAVSEYDEEAARLTVRRVAGLTEEELARMVELFGMSPEKLVFEEFEPEAHEQLMSGRLVELPGGLYQALMKRVPPDVADGLSRQMGIERVMAVGFHRKGRLYGNLVLYFRSGQKPNPRLIEAFVGQWSIAFERQEAEEHERQERTRAETYLDIAGTIVMALDSRGRITLINRKGCELLGVTRKEALGADWFSRFIIEPDRQVVRQAFDSLMRGELEPAEQFENRVITVGGEVRLVHWCNTLLRDKQGRITGTLSSGEDVTEQRCAEAALAQSREQYRVLFEAAPYPMLLIKEERCLLANPVLAEMLGYDNPNELTDLSVLELIATEARELVAGRLARLANGDGNPEVAIRLLARDGSVRELIVTSRPVVVQGEPVALVIGRDVTALRVAEDRLERQVAMQDLLIRITDGFINLPPGRADAAIESALAELGEFVGADRAYLFDYDFDRQVCNNTHEWCVEGIKPQIEYLQSFPLEAVPESLEPHRRGQVMHIPDVSALPVESSLRRELAAESIKSLITVPLMDGGQCIGFVGFDSVQVRREYDENEQRLLKMFAQTLVHFQRHRRAEESLRESESRFRLIADRTPVVFYFCRFDERWTMLYLNNAIEQLTGYPKEVLLKDEKSYAELIAPEDRTLVHDGISRALAAGSSFHLVYRIVHTDGSYRRVEEFGDAMRRDGEVQYLVGTIMDITDPRAGDAPEPAH